MEPYRPHVDRDILAFVQSQTFTPRDFVIDSKGVCRLHPELVREVAGAGVPQGSLAAIAGLFEPVARRHDPLREFQESCGTIPLRVQDPATRKR